MSFIEIACSDVLSSVIFIIEGEIDLAPQAPAISLHLQNCIPCTSEISHERMMREALQAALRRTCDERAPQDLHESIHQRLQEQMAGGAATEVVTQFSMTEISIEIDEFGNVEHREIQIEQTHIQHFIDNDEQ